jgi:uncharacterized protein YcgI (DUF1989 family)
MTRILKNTTHLEGGGSAHTNTNCSDSSTREPQSNTHVVPVGHGHAFEVKKGVHFRIVDVHGQQVVEFAA